MVLEKFLPFLICPVTGEDLRLGDNQSFVYSSKRRYPIYEGIVDMKVETVKTQQQTADIFSKKWSKQNKINNKKAEDRQKNWYLELYGFDSEKDLAAFLQKHRVIVDAGAGRGYKAAWFASIAQESLVIAVEISESVYSAAKNYVFPNLLFIRGDISNIPIKNEVADYISCDQVIHHTSNPRQTFNHLCEKLKRGGEFSCYVYRKKALSRELLDDYFRLKSQSMTKDELMEMSTQLTELGKRLDTLNVEFDCPDIPAMNIKGGRYTVQRFLYWNFLKCFWNPELGEELSTLCNFDWYAPSQAARYTKEEFLQWVSKNKMEVVYFHEEEACYSGRFRK